MFLKIFKIIYLAIQSLVSTSCDRLGEENPIFLGLKGNYALGYLRDKTDTCNYFAWVNWYFD